MCCYHGLNQSVLIAYAQMSITPNMAMCGSRGGIGGLYPPEKSQVICIFPLEKVEPATPGLQGKRFIHYTTAAPKFSL